jgi:hypothetical protein
VRSSALPIVPTLQPSPHHSRLINREQWIAVLFAIISKDDHSKSLFATRGFQVIDLRRKRNVQQWTMHENRPSRDVTPVQLSWLPRRELCKWLDFNIKWTFWRLSILVGRLWSWNWKAIEKRSISDPKLNDSDSKSSPQVSSLLTYYRTYRTNPVHGI